LTAVQLVNDEYTTEDVVESESWYRKPPESVA
jgi:hypothetical protein